MRLLFGLLVLAAAQAFAADTVTIERTGSEVVITVRIDATAKIAVVQAAVQKYGAAALAPAKSAFFDSVIAQAVEMLRKQGAAINTSDAEIDKQKAALDALKTRPVLPDLE